MIKNLPEAVRNCICRHLPSQDLKRVRLVCKELDFSAQRALFQLVCLRPNIDSFHNLDLISRHPVLRRHVETIHYNGEMVQQYPDFDHWNKKLGGEIDMAWASRDLLRKQFTTEDLNYHYLKYRQHIEGQTYIDNDDNAKQWLVKIFKKLPQIDTVEYTTQESDPDVEIADPIVWSSLSAIGRETLSEPCNFGILDSPTQFITLLQAASQNCKNLTTIKGFYLEWEIFESSDQLRTMLAAVKNIQHLILNIPNFPDMDLEGHRKKLARVIANAPDLKTLELFFGRLPSVISESVMKLGQLLKSRSHWPTLQRLVLQGFCTSEVDLRRLLGTHAATLKSLGLSDVDFPPLGRQQESSGGSFFSLIKFLKSSLSLEHMEFNGTFCNHWDEGWVVNWRNEYAHDKECLKVDIERFVVYGGECPLKAPDVDEDESWADQGDDSWRHEPELLT